MNGLIKVVGLGAAAMAAGWIFLTPKKLEYSLSMAKVLSTQAARSSFLRYLFLCAFVLTLTLRRVTGYTTYRKRTFAASFLIVWAAFYRLFVIENARARFQRTHFNIQVAERAGLTQELFKPVPWAFAAPGQTITCLAVSTLTDRFAARQVVYAREVVTQGTFDGNAQFLDWARFESEEDASHEFSRFQDIRRTSAQQWEAEAAPATLDESDPAPLILLIHGFGEHRFHPPVLRFARRARELGWRAVVWSYWRFDFGETRDLKAVVEHLTRTNPQSPIIAVAWSAGGYLLFRYLEEYGADSGLACAVTLSPLQDAISSADVTQGTQNKIYSYYLGHLARVAVKRHLMGDKSLPAEVRKKLEGLAATITDGFELYDRFLFELPGGFSRKQGSAASYSFRGPTLSHYRPTNLDIHKVQVPTLVVHADDDPLVAGNIHDWPDMVRRNKNLLVVTTHRGGHEGHYDGFLPGGSTWDMRVGFRFISAVLETQAQIRHMELIVERKLLQYPETRASLKSRSVSVNAMVKGSLG